MAVFVHSIVIISFKFLFNFVLFHSNKRKVTLPIFLKIGRRKIKEENYVRFLGVLLDSTLSWKYHMSELSEKLARTVGLSPPKGDWVATVEDRAYEAVYRCSEKNYADFLSAPFMGKSWRNPGEISFL